MSNDLNVSFIDKGTIFFNFIVFDCISFYFLLCLVVFFWGKGGVKGQSLRWFTLSGPFSFSFECDIELILKR